MQENHDAHYTSLTAELKRWGYSTKNSMDTNLDYGDFKEYWSIDEALRDLYVSDRTKRRGGLFNPVYVTHQDLKAKDKNNQFIPVDYQVSCELQI